MFILYCFISMFAIILVLLIATLFNYIECSHIEEQMKQDEIKREQQFNEMIQKHQKTLTIIKEAICNANKN